MNINVEIGSYKEFCYVILRGIICIEEDVEFWENRNAELCAINKEHLKAAKNVYKQVFGRDYRGVHFEGLPE